MFKSKHSGWTWNLKRTPFGGGNPLDAVSSAIGTDGGGGGVLGGLAQLDKGVNQIPGGWYTVGGLAAGGTALAFAPELAALAGVDAGATIGSEAGQAAFFDALANGASSAEAMNAGFATDALATGTASYLTPELAGPTYGELGITGLPEGGMGPTYSEMGYTGLNQQAAIDAANAASGSSITDNLSNAQKIAKTLKSGFGSNTLQQLAVGQTGMGSEIPGIIRGNQNPFTYAPQQPIQDTRQAQLAKLLQQG